MTTFLCILSVAPGCLLWIVARCLQDHPACRPEGETP